ncbi:MAG: prepilin peptidase [Blastocatellia bacterium]|nr:prepilin peptidase [Blastocatellia bacterium]
MRIGLTSPGATIQDALGMWQEMSREVTTAEAPLALFLLIAFLFGLAVGSFLNVVIYRVPRRMSIVHPGSHCPHCGARIRWRDNIPILSFLLLKGRCRACHRPISWLYPAVEVGTALVFMLLVWERGAGWAWVPDAVFVSVLIALAAIDARHRLLPDALTYPGFVLAVGLRALVPTGEDFVFGAVFGGFLFEHALIAGAALIMGSSFLLFLLERVDYRVLGRRLEEQEIAHAGGGESSSLREERPLVEREEKSADAHAGDEGSRETWSPEWAALILAIGLSGVFIALGRDDLSRATSGVHSALGALVGAMVGSGVLWLSRLGYYALRRLEGVGFGDVKMMLMVGAFLGLGGTLLTIFLASLLGSIYGVTLMFLTHERNPKLPFGSFLSLAALVVLLLFR